jgi:DNA-binding CsgD family transcriptional regulator
MSPSQIADSLGISKETVRIHIRNIYGKLGVRSRHAAVLTLVRKGIFPLDAN